MMLQRNKLKAVRVCVAGAFVDGLAAGDIEESLQPISALRLLVHSDADVWALLSEVWSIMCVLIYTTHLNSSAVKDMCNVHIIKSYMK